MLRIWLAHGTVLAAHRRATLHAAMQRLQERSVPDASASASVPCTRANSDSSDGGSTASDDATNSSSKGGSTDSDDATSRSSSSRGRPRLPRLHSLPVVALSSVQLASGTAAQQWARPGPALRGRSAASHMHQRRQQMAVLGRSVRSECHVHRPCSSRTHSQRRRLRCMISLGGQ